MSAQHQPNRFVAVAAGPQVRFDAVVPVMACAVLRDLPPSWCKAGIPTGERHVGPRDRG